MEPDRLGTPLWVKIMIAILVLIAISIGIFLLGDIGGQHGPGRHLVAFTVLNSTKFA